MKLLAYITMTIVFVTTLYSSTTPKVVLYNETFFNNDKYTMESMRGSVDKKENVFSNKLRLRLYTDITDDLYFSTTGVYKYNNLSDIYIRDLIENKGYKTNETYFESLYFTYRLISKLHLTAGLVNFSDGSYVEISELDYVKGSGLSKLADIFLEAVFLTWNGDVGDWETITKLGYGTYNKIGISKSSTVSKVVGDSTGYYMLYEMYKGFDSIKFNYYKADLRKNGIPVARENVIGVGFNKYFLKSGINIFSTLGYSKSHIEPSVLSRYKTPPPNPFGPPVITPQLLFPNAFVTDRTETHGYLYSLGVNKDFSSNLIESYSIGMDYTHTTDNWYSFVNNDVSDYYNTRNMNGGNYHTWITVRPTKNVAIKTYYNIVNVSNAHAIGNLTVGIPHSDSLVPAVKKINRLGIKLIIKY